jgi:hypothetical protein
MRLSPLLVPCGVTLTLALTLGGCASPLEQLAGNLVQEGVERAIEDQVGADIEVGSDTGGTLPPEWPSEVPTVEGTVEFSIVTEEFISITVLTSDVATAQSAVALLIESGFTAVSELDYGGGNSSGIFENGSFQVTTLVSDNGDGTGSVQYTTARVAP